MRDNENEKTGGPTAFDSETQGAGDVNRLLQQSTCSSDDFYKYLNKINSDYAQGYIKAGKWPSDVQIPKSTYVLKADGSIDWSKAQKGGYVLDRNGEAVKSAYTPEIGEVVDRYGSDSGRYISPLKNDKPYSYAERSLPYLEDVSQYRQYEVVGDFMRLEQTIRTSSDLKLKRDIYEYVDVYYEGDFSKMSTYQGEIAEIEGWSKGGGIQYELPIKVEWLIKLGLLREVIRR